MDAAGLRFGFKHSRRTLNAERPSPAAETPSRTLQKVPLQLTVKTMSTYPKSPKEMTGGMMYFPRLIDKIRLHARGELGPDYHENLGAARSGDGMCCNFLRVDHAALSKRVLAGGMRRNGGRSE